MGAEPHAAMRFQHGEHHGEPARIPADHRAARRAERGRRDQRLDLDQQRPRALDAGEHGGAGRAEIALGQEQLGRVCNLAQTPAGHLEHADLVGRAEPVLDRAQDAELVRALALEREHRVDHVLDHARAGDLPSLVTWPTRMTAAPERLAKRISACAAPRTWVTVPGADSTVSVHMVWIESMTTRRGVLPSESVATMSSTEVSAASSTGASASPSRSARSRTCATASSPEM